MRKSSIAWAFVAALSIAGAAWARTGRITSIDSTGETVTVDTDGATSVEPSDLKVGDRVRIEPLSSGPENGAPTSTRRPRLGMAGIAVVGIAIFLRLRRPRTI